MFRVRPDAGWMPPRFGCLCALRHSMHHAGVGPLSMESYMGHTCISHGPEEKALSTALSFRSACTSLGRRERTRCPPRLSPKKPLDRKEAARMKLPPHQYFVRLVNNVTKNATQGHAQWPFAQHKNRSICCTSLGLQRGSSFHLFSIRGKQIAGAPNFSHDVS